jgi:hypothetical protein
MEMAKKSTLTLLKELGSILTLFSACIAFACFLIKLEKDGELNKKYYEMQQESIENIIEEVHEEHIEHKNDIKDLNQKMDKMYQFLIQQKRN